MPTGDELVTALRRGMQASTDNLNPTPGLAAEVRRRTHTTRGWLIAASVAVPLAAAVGIATVLLVGAGLSATRRTGCGRRAGHLPVRRHGSRAVLPG